VRSQWDWTVGPDQNHGGEKFTFLILGIDNEDNFIGLGPSLGCVKKMKNEGLMDVEMKRFMIGCLRVPCLVLLACVWIVGCTRSEWVGPKYEAIWLESSKPGSNPVDAGRLCPSKSSSGGVVIEPTKL
jgi:hypothetical protein